MATDDQIGAMRGTAEDRPAGVPADAKRDPQFDGSPVDELAYRLRQQRLLVDYGLFALRATERNALHGECVRIAAAGLQVDLAKYLEYRPETDDLLISAGIGWHTGTVGHAILSADFGSPAGYAFRTQRPVISNHLEREERFRTPELLARHGIRRAINVPVRDGGASIGVLEVDSPEAGQFTDADVAFLEGLGLLVSAATERLDATEALRHARGRERLLIGEMRHRVGNIFALMQGIVSMSVREARRGGEDVVDLIVGRLDALSVATETGLPRLAEEEEAADEARHDLLDLTRRMLAPYGDRVAISGADDLPALTDRHQTVVALLLHELATNAVKHGALAVAEGADGLVDVGWHAGDGTIHLDWSESGASKAAGRGGTAPSGGFGTGMIDTLLAAAGGTIRRDMGLGGLHIVATVGMD